jgi:ribose 5-phosphate isomerase A
VLRESSGFSKAGPTITDNGNFIIDWIFETKDNNDNISYNWKSINASLEQIPGVIETGLFVGMCNIAYFGNEDGTTVRIESNYKS